MADLTPEVLATLHDESPEPVFVFVPVYIEKKSDATVQPTTHGPLAKFLRVFFRQNRQLQPFWTWFIDNPRPPIAEMKTMLQSIAFTS